MGAEFWVKIGGPPPTDPSLGSVPPGAKTMLCPICTNPPIEIGAIESAVPRNLGVVEVRTPAAGVLRYQCGRCGTFAVTRDDEDDNLRDENTRLSFHPKRLSALLREQNLRRMPPFWLQFRTDTYGPLKSNDVSPIHVQELLSRWPRTVSDRIERTLCNLASLSPTGGYRVPIDLEDTSLTFAENKAEAGYHVACLLDRKWVVNYGPDNHADFRLVLTPKGWERFEGLRAQDAPENDVFVAMWYGTDEKKANNDYSKAEMKRVYDEGIEPAVRRAGYHATRVDLEHFNDFIMDQVFSSIRAAPFVVADFTGHRNGVYLEAGFARGLGIPVIHTCKKDHLDDAHFDVKQMNHIVWTTEAELAEQLYYRIRNTVGPGPFDRVMDRT